MSDRPDDLEPGTPRGSGPSPEDSTAPRGSEPSAPLGGVLSCVVVGALASLEARAGL